MTQQQRGAPAPQPQTQALAVTPIETATQAIALVPQSLDGAMQLARWLATSSFLPDKLRGKEGDIFCLVLAGVELGLPPMAALRGLYIVNGKTAMESKTKAAICIQRGAALYFRRIEYTPVAVTWETQRRGEAEPRTSRYTRQEAEAAGLLGKDGPWRQYTQRMISHRALGWLCDDTYPDVVLGVATAEDFEIDNQIAFSPIAAVGPGIELGTTPARTASSSAAAGPASAGAAPSSPVPASQAGPAAAPASLSRPAGPPPGVPHPPEAPAPLTEDEIVELIEELSRCGTKAALTVWRKKHCEPALARASDVQRDRLARAAEGQLAEIELAARGAS